MFERFTEDARRALFWARYEAQEDGSLAIETEDLLLGLIQRPRGLMGLVLARTQLPFELIRQEIKNRIQIGVGLALEEKNPRQIGLLWSWVFWVFGLESSSTKHQGLLRTAISEEIGFSAETKRVLHHAVTEADRLGHNYIDAEHLLLGILNEESCIAASILTAKGMGLETCRDWIVQAHNAQDDFLRLYPHQLPWINQCPGCQRKGHKPDMPNIILLILLFPPLVLQPDGLCEVCSATQVST